MKKNVLYYLFIFTIVLTVFNSCKKDKDEVSDYPISMTIGEETVKWHKDQLEWCQFLTSPAYSVMNLKFTEPDKRFQLYFTVNANSTEWLNHVHITEFEITEELFPNFIVLNMDNNIGNANAGGYISKGGLIKVNKIKDQRLYLTYTATLESNLLNEVIHISGHIDGLPFTIKENI